MVCVKRVRGVTVILGKTKNHFDPTQTVWVPHGHVETAVDWCKAKLSVVVAYPSPSEGWGLAEDHGAPEAGKLPRVWTRGRRETESRQRVSGAEL